MTPDEINAMTPMQIRSWEHRLRRMAKRQRLVLVKSRARDPRSYEYGGYVLADMDTNAVVAGSGGGRAFSMQIDDVETYLTDDKKPKRRHRGAA